MPDTVSRFLVLSALLALAACSRATPPAPAAAAPPTSTPPVSAGTEQASVPPPATVVQPVRGVGTTQPVSGDANPQAASVMQALQDGRHPERLSLMIPPKPFDPAAFARDPQAYLNVVEPGRVFQTAQPGPGVPRLAPVGANAARVQTGERTMLRVRAAPGAPVSWAALDLGSFANQLNAITVQADREGLAEVAFTATAGASHTLQVLAGSPLASGQVRFVVDVLNQGLVPVPAADVRGATP